MSLLTLHRKFSIIKIKTIFCFICLQAMEKPTSAKSKASTSSGHRDNSPPKSAGSKSSKKSPSPSRKAKNVSPNRKSGGELKVTMIKYIVF
jgi:hypothetical protein